MLHKEKKKKNYNEKNKKRKIHQFQHLNVSIVSAYKYKYTLMFKVQMKRCLLCQLGYVMMLPSKDNVDACVYENAYSVLCKL